MRSSNCHSQCSSSNDRGRDPREADVSSSVHHNLCHHITPTSDQFLTEAWDDVTTSFKEHFPTALLNDVRTEGQILDRHLCIHERPDNPNHQCSLVQMTTPPLALTYCYHLCKIKQCLIMNRWTLVTSHQIFQTS